MRWSLRTHRPMAFAVSLAAGLVAAGAAVCDSPGVRIAVDASGMATVQRPERTAAERKPAHAFLEPLACEPVATGVPPVLAAAPDTAFVNVMAMIDWLQDCRYRVVFLSTLGPRSAGPVLVRISTGPLRIAPIRMPSAQPPAAPGPPSPPRPLPPRDPGAPEPLVLPPPPRLILSLPPAAPNGAALVRLSKDGSLTVYGPGAATRQTSMDGLTLAVADALQTAEPTGSVYLTADLSVPFEAFMALVQRLHQSGHPGIRIIATAVPASY